MNFDEILDYDASEKKPNDLKKPIIFLACVYAIYNALLYIPWLNLGFLGVDWHISILLVIIVCVCVAGPVIWFKWYREKTQMGNNLLVRLIALIAPALMFFKVSALIYFIWVNPESQIAPDNTLFWGVVAASEIIMGIICVFYLVQVFVSKKKRSK